MRFADRAGSRAGANNANERLQHESDEVQSPIAAIMHASTSQGACRTSAFLMRSTRQPVGLTGNQNRNKPG